MQASTPPAHANARAKPAPEAEKSPGIGPGDSGYQDPNVAQSAYTVSCQVESVASDSRATAFHRSRLLSGNDSLMVTLAAASPVTRAPPPKTRLPDGQVAVVDFELVESIWVWSDREVADHD